MASGYLPLPTFACQYLSGSNALVTCRSLVDRDERQLFDPSDPNLRCVAVAWGHGKADYEGLRENKKGAAKCETLAS